MIHPKDIVMLVVFLCANSDSTVCSCTQLPHPSIFMID